MLRLQQINGFTVACALFMATAAAQTTATSWNSVQALPAGLEVRIAAGARTIRGRIDRVSGEAIAVTSGKGQEMFSQQEISRVSVQKQGHRKRNALIGLGVGGAAGLGVGLAASSCGGFGCIGAGAVEIGAPIAFAVVGTVVGAVIPTGGWREVYRK